MKLNKKAYPRNEKVLVGVTSNDPSLTLSKIKANKDNDYLGKGSLDIYILSFFNDIKHRNALRTLVV